MMMMMMMMMFQFPGFYCSSTRLLPSTANVPLLRAAWSLLDALLGVLSGQL